MFETDIFNRVYTISDRPCYLCARMRRGYLYENAKKHGCNKIALGHHFDDVIETIMMSILYAGQYQTMMPKLKSTSHPGMELIRPLYYVRENDIINWADKNQLDFIKCACRFTENSAKDENHSKRMAVKKLLEKLREDDKTIDMNIFNSSANVNIDTVIEYKQGGERFYFGDNY